MASFHHLHSLSLLIFSFIFLSSQTPSSPHPNALVLQVSKHASTLQYVTQINQRTPLVPTNVVVDLGGQFLWVSFDSSYVSSSYKQTNCHSAQCSLAHDYNNIGCNNHCFNTSRPRWCSSNNTCILFSENVFTRNVSAVDVSEDVLSLQSTNGLNPSFMASVPQFLFLCAPKFLLKGLANGAKGIMGLGHGPIGLPIQLSSAFNFTKKFAICLPPSLDTNGVIFFGDEPYVFLPNINVGKIVTYTPLIIRPRRKHRRNYNIHAPSPSPEYFIQVRSIRVNGKDVPLNSSLLSINNRGIGGTKISTVDPYMLLETSIYRSLTAFFIREAMAADLTRVAPVAPFDVCFSTKVSNGSLSRPALPVIDLMLQDERVFWRIFETNLMVLVGNEIACLGVLDAGLNPRSSIVIGGYQLEDNFLQFDLVSKRLGFTSSLLLWQTSCANFNFTSIV